MGKHRDDGEMSHKSSDHEKSHKKSDDGALGPDEGTPRKRMEAVSDPTGSASHDSGALGADEGTSRADPQPGAHAEFGGGKHEHSPHMPGQKDQPNV